MQLDTLRSLSDLIEVQKHIAIGTRAGDEIGVHRRGCIEDEQIGCNRLVDGLARFDPELEMTEEELEHLRDRIHIYSLMAIVVLTWRAPDEQPAISHTEDAESAISHTELILSESAFYFERHEAIETHPCKRAARYVSFRCRRAWNDRRLLAPATSSLSSFAGLFVIAPRPLFCLSGLSLPCSW